MIFKVSGYANDLFLLLDYVSKNKKTNGDLSQ